MAKQPNTQRRQSQRQEGTTSAFDTLYPQQLGPDDPTPENKTDTKATAEVSVADLLKQIGEMNARMDEMSRVNAAISSQRTEPALPQRPGPVSFDDLPDPVTEKEAFAKEMNRRMEDHRKAEQEYDNAVTAQKQDQANQTQDLFDDFSAQNPDYVSDMERLELAAEAAAKAVVKRGIDARRYMTTNRDRWFKDVKSHYNRLFGDPTDDDQDDKGDTRGNRGDDRDTPATRTGGIFGGQESGGRPGPSNRREAPGDMNKELRDIQGQMRIFGAKI